MQVNNIHIVRGMLGKPGCGVLQMNGQPTAENPQALRQMRWANAMLKELSPQALAN